MIRRNSKDESVQLGGPACIEFVQIRTLRPNPRNARTHSARQIRLIKDSIQKFGQIKPVIIDDNSVILAGHGFIEAARLAGLNRVAVLRFSHLTETQKRAYLLADNKIAEEAGWNREMLAIELGELVDLLPAEGFDVSLTGFETAEIDLLLADMAPSTPEPVDAIPVFPQKAIALRGDIWLLGKHRLMCGDAQEAADVKRLMNGASASAVFCDPPYNRPARSIGSRGQVKHSDFAFASGEMSAARFKKFLAQTLGNGVLVSAEGAVHFVCMDWRHIAELVDVGRDLYGALFCKSPQLVGLSAMYASAISGCRNAWLEREDSNSRIPDRTRSLRAIRDIWEYCRAKSEA